MTREIAVEYARLGIRANALCPGPVNTLFLASDESSYVTGTTFLVDGGINAAYVTPE